MPSVACLIHYKVQCRDNYKGVLADPLSTLLPHNIRITLHEKNSIWVTVSWRPETASDEKATDLTLAVVHLTSYDMNRVLKRLIQRLTIHEHAKTWIAKQDMHIKFTRKQGNAK